MATTYPVEEFDSTDLQLAPDGEMANVSQCTPRQDGEIRAPIEQLGHVARRLADGHRLGGRNARNALRVRIKESEAAIADVHRLLNHAAGQKWQVSASGEWFLDNHYFIQGQIRTVWRSLPNVRDAARLETLSTGHERGTARVYDMAAKLVQRLGGRLDEQSIEAFVAAYQDVLRLSLGELWAFPMVLRVALIERLGRVALKTRHRFEDRARGAHWAERCLEASSARKGVSPLVEQMIASERPLGRDFLDAFARSMVGLTKDGQAVYWLKTYLADRGESVEGIAEAIRRDEVSEATAVRDAIASLRLLDGLPWQELVERQSAIERILRQDPAGVYSRMDASGREHYRSEVQQLARCCELSEAEVARRALELSVAGAAVATTDGEPVHRDRLRRSHVGYYLIDRGRPALETAIGYRTSPAKAIVRVCGRRPLISYLIAIFLTWALSLSAGLLAGLYCELPVLVGPAMAVLLALLLAGVVSQFAVNTVNWFVTLVVRPKPIMRLDFAAGIPADCAALVVVPAMLTSEVAARRLVCQLELRYLANRDEHLRFGLLTDFADAPEETSPSDRRLLAIARSEIDRLNDRYGHDGRTTFYLLHRPRKWNAREGCWMGEERKRGKIAAVTHLLRTGSVEPFSVTTGDLRQLAGIRYVITLDTDTRLPPLAARQLVGCMAHPLNFPRIDPETGVVVEGHAILQPRTGASIVDARRTLFSALVAGDAGIDPYTRQTSDVYQDLFGCGSFIGKGIFDVEAFSAALEGRFPPNRILSHDLVEGCFARSGLINDVELFEEVPCHLLADMGRRHRWIRGDWQIASWLRRRVPSAGGRARNPLDALSRWKIFDNLRRSLMPPFLLALLIAGWVASPALAVWWTLLAVVLSVGPALLCCLPGAVAKPSGKPWALHSRDQRRSCLRVALAEVISWCVLPYTAMSHVDAIVRALYRVYVSRRKLLEWVTTCEAEARCPQDWRSHYRIMWACSALPLALTAFFALTAPFALMSIAPVAACWLAGPWLAWRVSRREDAAPAPLPVRRARQVRRWARQTWHYFESFVNEQGHWLPPDNVQEHPYWAVARRTSPTNIGMALLADLAAHDLGHLSTSGWLARIKGTLNTLTRMERHRGHFYNWYETPTLQPIEPRYVSSVDSGNLWGSLIVLRNGLEELRERPVVATRLFEGLQDTLEVIERLRSAEDAFAFSDQFDACLAHLREQCVAPLPGGARNVCARLCRVRALAANLAVNVPEDPPALMHWTQALVRQCAEMHGDVARLAFWMMAPSPDSDAQREWSLGLTDEVDRRAFRDLCTALDALNGECTLGQIPTAAAQAVEQIDHLLAVRAGDATDDGVLRVVARLRAIRRAAERAAVAAQDELQQIDALCRMCRELSDMDFRFLFDKRRNLLSIGFNVTQNRRDESYYDLLASEARLASFLGIAHGQLPLDHWFSLGRMMGIVEGEPVLLSWSGSMFEYLMPLLFMPCFRGTLLDDSCRAAVRRQIRYARRQMVPFGISESCYNAVDSDGAYQYRAFGVLGLGLDRSIGEHLVVAPYASALAAMISPSEACHNLDRLEQLGYLSPCGFYDAIEYTSQRPLPSIAPCKAVMAHHSGMTLLALTHVLLNGPMVRRFFSEPLHAAYDLLLQERVPQAIRPADPVSTAPPRPQRIVPQAGESVVSPLPVAAQQDHAEDGEAAM